MNNKRYVLTNNCENEAQLWEMDTARCVTTFNKSFKEAQKLLDETYDLVHSKENPLPQTWATCDIKLGVSL
jgi:hypothetical protein